MSGVLYYWYPGNHGATTDFAEPFFSVAEAFGPLTAKATVNYAPKQKALSIGNGSEDNVYLAGDLAYAVPKTPLSLTAHLGHTWGPSYLSIGKEYADWNVGASFTHGPLSFGLQYVDTARMPAHPTLTGRTGAISADRASSRRSAWHFEEEFMKLVLAIIKPHKLDDVREALGTIDVQGLTVSEARGYRASKAPHRDLPWHRI